MVENKLPLNLSILQIKVFYNYEYIKAASKFSYSYRVSVSRN